MSSRLHDMDALLQPVCTYLPGEVGVQPLGHALLVLVPRLLHAERLLLRLAPEPSQASGEQQQQKPPVSVLTALCSVHQRAQARCTSRSCLSVALPVSEALPLAELQRRVLVQVHESGQRQEREARLKTQQSYVVVVRNELRGVESMVRASDDNPHACTTALLYGTHGFFNRCRAGLAVCGPACLTLWSCSARCMLCRKLCWSAAKILRAMVWALQHNTSTSTTTSHSGQDAVRAGPWPLPRYAKWWRRW